MHIFLLIRPSNMGSSCWATLPTYYFPKQNHQTIRKTGHQGLPRLPPHSTWNTFLLEAFHQQKHNLKRTKYLKRTPNKMLPGLNETAHTSGWDIRKSPC